MPACHFSLNEATKHASGMEAFHLPYARNSNPFILHSFGLISLLGIFTSTKLRLLTTLQLPDGLTRTSTELILHHLLQR
jgi:hypothetical protein